MANEKDLVKVIAGIIGESITVAAVIATIICGKSSSDNDKANTDLSFQKNIR